MLRATDVPVKFANDLRWVVSIDRVDGSSGSFQCFGGVTEFDGDGVAVVFDDGGDGDCGTDSIVIDLSEWIGFL